MRDDQATPILEHEIRCQMCQRFGMCRVRDAQRVLFTVQLGGIGQMRVCRDCGGWFARRLGLIGAEVLRAFSNTQEETNRVVWRTLWTTDLLADPAIFDAR